MVAWIKKLSLFLAAIIFLELILQLAAYFSPKFNYLLLREQPRWITDSKLKFRPDPSYPEHDKNGFRNEAVPTKTCLVALGDSQTYGWKVQASQAWPQQVGFLGKITPYNMAVPQYCPVQGLLLWQEAMSVSPKFIIDGF